MGSLKKLLVYYVLRILRIILDFSTNTFFSWIYGKPKDIPPITNRILLQPAVELASKIRKQQLKSEDVVLAYISRIREVQPLINAVVDERYEEALKEAKAVDQFIRSGTKTEEQIEKDTPLLGVPFSCKEAIAVKGLSWTSGAVSRKGIKADTDAIAVRAVRAAGAIPLVSTNVCEFCIWWNATNNLYGITRNPYDTRRGPGGSSGGEGALLAAAGSVIGVGSDIGGSIRLPSFMNGIFGHKPSIGVVSCEGLFPPHEGELLNYGVIGPMCRYASDLLPMMKILAGKNRNLKLRSKVDFRNLKIYYMEDEGGNPFMTPVVPEIKRKMQQALKHFEEKYKIQSKKVNFEAMKNGFYIFFTMFAEANAPSIAEEMKDRKGKANLKWEFLKWCLRCSNHPLQLLFMGSLGTLFPEKGSEKAAKIHLKFEALKKQFEEILKDNCVFLYPTQPEPAPFINQTIPKVLNVGYTCIFNILGYPSTHIPLGFSRGLPIGIQTVGALHNDHLTIAVAEELEKAFGGWISPSIIKAKAMFSSN